MLQPELAMFPQSWTSLACGSWPSHGVGGRPSRPSPSPVRSFEKEMEGKRVFSLAKPLAAAGRALEKRQGGPVAPGDPAAHDFVEETWTTAFSSIFMLNFCSCTI